MQEAALIKMLTSGHIRGAGYRRVRRRTDTQGQPAACHGSSGFDSARGWCDIRSVQKDDDRGNAQYPAI